MCSTTRRIKINKILKNSRNICLNGDASLNIYRSKTRNDASINKTIEKKSIEHLGLKSFVEANVIRKSIKEGASLR